MLRSSLLLLAVCSPLSAQSLGAVYQIARSNQVDTRHASGPGVRLRFRRFEFRYDFLGARGQRFDTPCGGFIPPNCGPETIEYASDLHSVFVALRAQLLSRGPVQLVALPEVGFVSGTITKQGTTSQNRTDATGGAPGAGVALELSVPHVRSSSIGVWIAGRFRGFVHPGAYAVDGYDPHRELDWISSLELGLSFAPR